MISAGENGRLLTLNVTVDGVPSLAGATAELMTVYQIQGPLGGASNNGARQALPLVVPASGTPVPNSSAVAWALTRSLLPTDFPVAGTYEVQVLITNIPSGPALIRSNVTQIVVGPAL